MRNRYLYSRLVYSMAYVCSAFILIFAALGIPNDLLIAFAIACLVAGGFINTQKDDAPRSVPARKMKYTTFEQEMREARKMAQSES